jgi:multidrug transporter EmrE-like cation transporter
MLNYLLVLTAAILVSLVQVSFKTIAVRHADDLFQALFDYRLYLSLIVYLLAFCLWMLGLCKVDFAVAIPLNVLSIIVAGIFGYYYFQEPLSFIRLLSYGIIVVGVMLLSFDYFSH